MHDAPVEKVGVKRNEKHDFHVLDYVVSGGIKTQNIIVKLKVKSPLAKDLLVLEGYCLVC